MSRLMKRVVEVNAPKLDISGNLVVLPSNYLDAGGLLDNPCLGRYADQASSFLLRGRGGVPAEPDGLLPASAGIFTQNAFHASSRAKNTLPSSELRTECVPLAGKGSP